MKLSVVATLYQSALYVREFYERTTKVAKAFAGEDYEIILVNDGSPDNSLELSLEITKEDSHLVVIDLSRNFGHHKAMMAGLSHARGDLVFLIDSDLEEAPEWLFDFARQLYSDKSDVVYGVQENRKGSFFERWSGEVYYRMLNIFFNLNHPKNITTARLMTRRYVQALLQHSETELVISGLWVITGFKQTERIVKKLSFSPTNYSISKKISHLVNTVTSFTAKPLVWIFFCGFFISFFAVLYGLNLIIRRLFFSISVDGFTSIMVSIWFLGGLTILFIGIIGIYLSKIFAETKKRPLFIVREKHGNI